MQSEVYGKLDGESSRVLQCNIGTKKVASILAAQERMVETTRAWKVNRALPVESDKCRIWRQTKETVMHWLSGCTRIAATEHLWLS